jgi:hypothetical protein
VEEIGVKFNKGNPRAGLENQVISAALFVKKREQPRFGCSFLRISLKTGLSRKPSKTYGLTRKKIN